jgi:group I intron endonuclease
MNTHNADLKLPLIDLEADNTATGGKQEQCSVQPERLSEGDDNKRDVSMKIYWIHLPKHTDILKEGYVGITSNIDKRKSQYKRISNNKAKKGYHITKAIIKYGWDNLVISIIEENLSLEKALLKEALLRPSPNIGWNIMAGGGNGSKLSKNTKRKISKSMMGNVNTKGFSLNIVTCPYCKKKGQEASMKRWHFKNCKYY